MTAAGDRADDMPAASTVDQLSVLLRRLISAGSPVLPLRVRLDLATLLARASLSPDE